GIASALPGLRLGGSDTTPAPLAPAGLAVLLGVLARGLLLCRARRRRRTFLRLGRAGRRIEAELLHAGREVLGQLGRDVERSVAGIALGLVYDQAARVEMHLATDRAGQEGVLSAIFAVAHDRMPDGGHVHAELVGAAGERLQLDPGGTVAGAIDHAVASPGRLAVL